MSVIRIQVYMMSIRKGRRSVFGNHTENRKPTAPISSSISMFTNTPYDEK